MRTRVTVVAVAAVVLSAACGSADDGGGVAGADQLVAATTLAPTGTGDVASLGTSTTDAAGEVTAEEAFLAFAECMRVQGIEVNDPEFEADGTLRLNLRSLIVGEVDEEAMAGARDVCDVELEGITQTFEREDRSDIEDQLLAFAQCMRDNGYDMPDPVYIERTHSPGQGGGGEGGPFGKLDRTDPEFIAANDVCLPRFDDLWWGPGGGLGGGAAGGGGEE